jgi:hypothetical protein
VILRAEPPGLDGEREHRAHADDLAQRPNDLGARTDRAKLARGHGVGLAIVALPERHARRVAVVAAPCKREESHVDACKVERTAREARHASLKRERDARVTDEENVGAPVRTMEKGPRHHRVLEEDGRLERDLPHRGARAADVFDDGAEERRADPREQLGRDHERLARRRAERADRVVLMLAQEQVHLGEAVPVEPVVDDRAEHLGEPDLFGGAEPRCKVDPGHANASDALVRLLPRRELSADELADRAVHRVGADDREVTAGAEAPVVLEPRAEASQGQLAFARADREQLLAHAQLAEDMLEALFERVDLGGEVARAQEFEELVEAAVVERMLELEVGLGRHAQPVAARVRRPLVEEAERPCVRRLAGPLEQDAPDDREKEPRGARADDRTGEALGCGMLLLHRARGSQRRGGPSTSPNATSHRGRSRP